MQCMRTPPVQRSAAPPDDLRGGPLSDTSPLSDTFAGDPWTGEPLATNALQPITIALAACLAAVWLAVNSLLAASGISASPGSQFLGKLLHLWGSASALGLQALLQRLQVVGSGLLLAPPQLQRYRTLAHSVDWAALGWAGGRCP